MSGIPSIPAFVSVGAALIASPNSRIREHRVQQARGGAEALAKLEKGQWQVCDLLCRTGGLNHSCTEQREVNLFKQAGFVMLSCLYPNLKRLGWARLAFALESYTDEVRQVVHAMYQR